MNIARCNGHTRTSERSHGNLIILQIKHQNLFMEGLWPDPDTYRIIHESEKWQQARNNHSEMMGKVFATEIYRRVLKAN